MAKPIVATLSHSLGVAAAQKRLADGLEKARQELSGVFPDARVVWTGNHADLKLAAMGQQVTAGVDVFEDHVRIEVSLPWYLAPVQGKIAQALERQSARALQIGHAKS